MNDVMALPIGGHRPANLLRRIRQFITNDFSDILELIPDALVLGKDVFIDRFRRVSAIVRLILSPKGTTAFGAFPHVIHLH